MFPGLTESEWQAVEQNVGLTEVKMVEKPDADMAVVHSGFRWNLRRFLHWIMGWRK